LWFQSQALLRLDEITRLAVKLPIKGLTLVEYLLVAFTYVPKLVIVESSFGGETSRKIYKK
jgi:hypothetical protein